MAWSGARASMRPPAPLWITVCGGSRATRRKPMSRICRRTFSLNASSLAARSAMGVYLPLLSLKTLRNTSDSLTFCASVTDGSFTASAQK